jgi:hypothetical protein
MAHENMTRAFLSQDVGPFYIPRAFPSIWVSVLPVDLLAFITLSGLTQPLYIVDPGSEVAQTFHDRNGFPADNPSVREAPHSGISNPFDDELRGGHNISWDIPLPYLHVSDIFQTTPLVF